MYTYCIICLQSKYWMIKDEREREREREREGREITAMLGVAVLGSQFITVVYICVNTAPG